MSVRETSIEAFADIQPELNDRQQAILEIIDELGPGTSRELYRKARKRGRVPRSMVYSGFQPRFTELEDSDLIEVKEKRSCDVTGKTATVWRPTKKGQQALIEGDKQ